MTYIVKEHVTKSEIYKLPSMKLDLNSHRAEVNDNLNMHE